MFVRQALIQINYQDQEAQIVAVATKYTCIDFDIQSSARESVDRKRAVDNRVWCATHAKILVLMRR